MIVEFYIILKMETLFLLFSLPLFFAAVYVNPKDT